MSTLNISMLGRMKVSAQEDHSEIRMTHVVQELLSYLVFNRGRSISRELLADLLWGKYEPKHARDSLNTAIWRLRKLFQNSQINDKNYIATSVDNVCFISSGDFYLDIAEYETLWDRIRVNSKELSTQTVRDLNRIIELYKGDLLEGLFIDWVLTERERLRLIYLSCLAELMDFYHSQNAPEKAMEYAQKILTVDPLREDIHREVMQFYLEL